METTKEQGDETTRKETNPEVAAALFEIMRFNVLTAAFSPTTKDRLSDAYVFAWDNRVYPFFTGDDRQREAFSSAFHVDKSMIEELVGFLDAMWLAKTVPTFYELEGKYRGKGRWDRMELVWACHYMKLAGCFDEEFWKRLMGYAPSEASSISREYNREKNLYLN